MDVTTDALISNTQTLLPTLIDQLACADPHRLYCVLVKSQNVADGVRRVTYSDFVNAVNRCAWWLEEKFGKSSDFTTLSYAGPSDIRHAMVALAASKTGHKAMLISPTNSITGQVNLLESMQCNVLLLAGDFPAFKPASTAILAMRNMEIVELESLEYWLASERVLPYPFEATLDDNPTRPFVVLHTSGSTGLPNPVTWTFAALASLRYTLSPKELISDAPTTEWHIAQKRCHYVPFAPFHMIQFLFLTATNVYWEMPPIMPPPNIVPTVELASSIINLDICEAALLNPTGLQALIQDQEHLERLAKLKHIFWCGAALSSATVADTVRAYVDIYCAYGSTEMGPIPLTVEKQEDHEWMGFSPLIGATFRYYSNDLYELVLVKDAKIQKAQFIFLNNPELSEWPTKDLFSKHPSKDLWRYRGRSDDIIVLSSGFNINPLGFETIVTGNSMIESALLTGTGRASPAWLIECKEAPATAEETSNLIDQIWPSIEQANDVAPVYARASKRAIVITTKEKPMLRAGKGTVQRQLTIQTYQEELEALYNS